MHLPTKSAVQKHTNANDNKLTKTKIPKPQFASGRHRTRRQLLRNPPPSPFPYVRGGKVGIPRPVFHGGLSTAAKRSINAFATSESQTSKVQQQAPRDELEENKVAMSEDSAPPPSSSVDDDDTIFPLAAPASPEWLSPHPMHYHTLPAHSQNPPPSSETFELDSGDWRDVNNHTSQQSQAVHVVSPAASSNPRHIAVLPTYNLNRLCSDSTEPIHQLSLREFIAMCLQARTQGRHTKSKRPCPWKLIPIINNEENEKLYPFHLSFQNRLILGVQMYGFHPEEGLMNPRDKRTCVFGCTDDKGFRQWLSGTMYVPTSPNPNPKFIWLFRPWYNHIANGSCPNRPQFFNAEHTFNDFERMQNLSNESPIILYFRLITFSYPQV